MNYYIITGTSRGLGEAITKKLLADNNYLICISRTKNNTLIEMADKSGYNLHYIECDLSQVSELDKMISIIFMKIDKNNIESVNLINNAGTVTPVKAIENADSEDIINSFNVNTIAPVLLTSKFISKLTDYKCEKRIINISSGAGKKPYDGWSCYCSAKAALDMFTRCVAVEQDKREHPVKIISFAPGIIDTKMQNEIRQSSVENFSQLERFIGFKDSGLLMPAEYVADKVIELLHDENFLQGGVIDIKDRI